MIKQQTKSEALNIAKPAGGDEILPLLEAVLDGRINKKTTVIFICTGNTCRSPMAAAYLNHCCGDKYTAESAGISAHDGDPISENAVIALKEAGILPTPEHDYTRHRAHTLTDNNAARADIIVTMTEQHATAVLYAFPQFAGKIIIMPRPISDPFGGTVDRYKKCLSEIISCVDELFHVDGQNKRK
ncbi:MAG: low molecular weight protein arginine phosphatase [Eubacteriales bacterium]|jgi:protein-tyrosine-phosphatase